MLVCCLVFTVERGIVFNIDLKSMLLFLIHIFLNRIDIVADFTFEAYIGYKAMSGLCIDARQVACIRVAVGIAVFYIEQDDKFVSIFNGFTHSCCSSSFFSDLA